MAISVTGKLTGVLRRSDQSVVTMQEGSYKTAYELGVDSSFIEVPVEYQNGRLMVMTDAGWIAASSVGVGVGFPGSSASFDENLARTNNATRARIIYSYLPKFIPFGRQLPVGGIYFDSNYAGTDSDGTIDRPFNTIAGRLFTTPGQIINLKRGSVFYTLIERFSMIYIRAAGIQFRDYGDPSAQPPLITGLRQVTATFTGSANSEYVADFPLTLGFNCLAVAYGDQLPGGIMVVGTPGALQAGQAGWAANKLYVKDNPAGRTVYASAASNVLVIEADGFRMDGVHTGYTSNNTIGLLPPTPGGSVTDAIFRDTACWFSGNSAISGGDVGKAATNVIIIRHQDTGAYNNGISGQGDDSNWWVIEPFCTGQRRTVAQAFPGYVNDAVTAHGTGLGPWIVAGGTMSNVTENGIDLIGGGVGGNDDVHRGSVSILNRIFNCNEIGLFMWCKDAKVLSNIVTDCGWEAIRIGNQAQISSTFPAEVAYNFTARAGSSASGAGSGIVPVWGGVYVHHNTMVISAFAQGQSVTKASMGNINVNLISGGRIENNLFVLEKDLPVLQFNASNGLLIAKFGPKGNVYVLPPNNTALPFQTGGTPLTYAQWSAQQERSSRSFADNTSAGISGPLYAPSIGSPIGYSLTLTSPGYDVSARFANGFVGASAIPEAATELTSGAPGLVDATAGAKIYQLPAVSAARGTTITVKKIDSSVNLVTVRAVTGELIDGLATFDLTLQWQTVQVYSNGIAWFIVSKS